MSRSEGSPGYLMGRVMGVRSFKEIYFLTVRWDGQDHQLFGNGACQVSFLDLVEARGEYRRTSTGHLSLFLQTPQQLHLLTRCTQPVGDKFCRPNQGVTALRRDAKMIYEPAFLEALKVRSIVLKRIHDFFHQRGHVQIDTPILGRKYGGAHATPFTVMRSSRKLFLSIAPQLELKMAIVGGLSKVYAITHCFRNEGIDESHHPEYTQVEFYEVGLDQFSMADLTVQLLKRLVDGYLPFIVRDVFFKDYMEVRGLPLDQTLFQELLTREPGFLRVFHRKDTTALCEPLASDPRFMRQCQIYLDGIELVNIYAECTSVERLKRHGTDLASNEDFERVVGLGLPPTGGMGMGLDRLIQKMTGTPRISDVIFSPLCQ